MTHHATQPHPVETARGSDAWHGDPDETPEADSPADVTTRAVNLDGDGVAYIEHIEGRVELTVKMRGRLNVALTLSTGEAAEMGRALALTDGPTLSDLFAVADAMHADASTLARAWGTAQHA